MFSVEQIVKIRRMNFLYCNEGNSPVEFFVVLCNYPYSSYRRAWCDRQVWLPQEYLTRPTAYLV